MRPKVTIGVCVKDSEDFIEEAIETIGNQDFPHELMEAIFVDDGSKDKTLSIIRSCTSKIDIDVTIFEQEWKGLGSARNVVVDNARGKYIVWVDGDMVLSADYISKLVDFMDGNPDIGIAKGKYNLTPGANWIATLEIYSRAAAKMIDFNAEGKELSRSMGTGGCIYRVEAIRKIGGFDEDVKGYGEDWDVEYKVKSAGWRLGIAEPRFRDYERRHLTWKDIWRKYQRRGYDSYSLSKKNKMMITQLYKWTPLAAFLSGLFHSLTLYRLALQEKVFLLPAQYTFKMTAWWIGFLKAYFYSR